jgi:hypothetical protein
MADVEDMCVVTYAQGESITVHMDDRDVVLTHREKMYMADFSDWLITEEDRIEELYTGLSLLTVAETEGKEVHKALEVGEFLKALGYPSERDALEVLRDDDIRNIPQSTDALRTTSTSYF